MTLERMDNVLIVVDDLDAAKAFFVELGMELDGEMPVEGPWVDLVVGLEPVREPVPALLHTRPRGHPCRPCAAAPIRIPHGRGQTVEVALGLNGTFERGTVGLKLSAPPSQVAKLARPARQTLPAGRGSPGPG